MPKIEKMFAFVCEDSGPDDEGIMGIQEPYTGIFMPLVGADMNRVKSLVEKAEIISQKVGKPYRILEFSVRKDVTEDFS